MATAEDAVNAEQLSLPTFEGKRPTGAQVRFTGTVNLTETGEVHQIGDRVTYEITGEVIAINHQLQAKSGLVRDQKVEVDSISLLKIEEQAGERVVSLRHRNDDIEEGQA